MIFEYCCNKKRCKSKKTVPITVENQEKTTGKKADKTPQKQDGQEKRKDLELPNMQIGFEDQNKVEKDTGRALVKDDEPKQKDQDMAAQ